MRGPSFYTFHLGFPCNVLFFIGEVSTLLAGFWNRGQRGNIGRFFRGVWEESRLAPFFAGGRARWGPGPRRCSGKLG